MPEKRNCWVNIHSDLDRYPLWLLAVDDNIEMLTHSKDHVDTTRSFVELLKARNWRYL